jgi:hypothetical protein
MTNISWKTVLSCASLLLAFVSAVAGGAFTIAKYAKDTETSAYRLAIEMQDRRIQELQERLKEKEGRTSSISSPNVGKEHPPETGVLSVQILRPLTTVPQFADVRFALRGTLPPGFKPLLVVRDPLGSWWSWGTTGSSTYYSVQFGVDADRGRQFELRIIVTDEDFPLNQPRRTLPRAIASSTAVVTRQ